MLRRLGTSLQAGLDPVRIWQREASGGPDAHYRRVAAAILNHLQQGGSLAEAMHQAGDYFPPLVVELVRVGEESGRLAEVCLELAEHFEYVLQVRRSFLASITWPVLQLLAALGVIGLLILLIGMFDLPDILGLGLKGPGGCAIYLGVLFGLGFGGWLLYRWGKAGAPWLRPLKRLLWQVPGLGRFLELLALSRLAWSLSLVLNTDMDLRRALPLALRSTGTDRYTRHIDAVVEAVVQGKSLSEALEQTGEFPVDFLDVVHVGETSGQLPESLDRLARTYQDQVQRMMQVVSTVGTFVVMVLVGLVLVGMIWALASKTLVPYYRTIQELSQPP